LVGIEAVTLDIPRRYTAIAGSACTVIPLNGAAVFKALRASPKTLSQFLCSNDNDLAEARLISLSSGFSSKARIADVLLDLAYRFGVDDGRRIRLDHWFTHQELADLAGAHRSTVTTAINDWIYDGMLKPQPRGLIINKPGTLRKAGTEASRKRKRKVATR
jgi:CRP-like cAMP-binding protein